MKRISWVFIFPLAGALSSCLPKDPGPDLATQQYIKDTTEISGYINAHSISATKIPDGVWFVIDSAAKGIRPTFNDSIKLKFTLKSLETGAVLLQSTTPKHFVLDSLMAGAKLALPQFQAGSKGRIFMPSYYSIYYAPGVVLPAGNMIMDFTLTEVKDHQLKLDTMAIDSVLAKRAITAVKDPSGLRYTIDTLKAGPKPFLTDDITFTYTAKTLAGVSVNSGNSVSFNLIQLILGWQIGLLNVQQGSTVTLYVPSSLAYGTRGTTGVGGNESLIFTVQLLKVTHH